jgi:hypothetical protein
MLAFGVKKSLSLNEIDGHQAIEHNRGIALTVTLNGDTLNEIEKDCTLFLKAIIKLLSNLLNYTLLS